MKGPGREEHARILSRDKPRTTTQRGILDHKQRWNPESIVVCGTIMGTYNPLGGRVAVLVSWSMSGHHPLIDNRELPAW